jgi:tetratricopeptide (TPR) repeat protein
LYAHKRLAEIYRDLGEHSKAIKEFKTVLKLNPMDDWAATNLMDIEAGPKPVVKEAKAPKTEEPTDEIAEVEDEEPSEVPVTEDVLEEIEEIPAEVGEEPLEEIEEIPAEVGEEPLEEIEEIPAEVGEEPLEEIEEVTYEIDEDVLEEVEAITPEAGEEILQVEEEGIEGTEEISEETAGPAEEVYKSSEVVFDQEEIASLPEEVSEEVSEERPVSMQDAEKYIAQDKYVDALRVYREILAKDPDNKQVIQRVEELRALLKLLGKDKEELIAKLNHMSEQFKKRRDEFLRNT